jgi:uncharacterized membrane protein
LIRLTVVFNSLLLNEKRATHIFKKRENSLYATTKGSSCALCHRKCKFELYAKVCIFSCALCHFRRLNR